MDAPQQSASHEHARNFRVRHVNSVDQSAALILVAIQCPANTFSYALIVLMHPIAGRHGGLLSMSALVKIWLQSKEWHIVDRAIVEGRQQLTKQWHKSERIAISIL